jgi:DNA-binding FrmR family transcriptional regulator
MIESERYCVDILVQTRAIIAALRFAEAEILNKHISSCVRDAMNSKDAGAVDVKLQEIMNLMQKIG